MTVTIEIHPSNSSLCMYGWPNRSTAYSLSGHVSVKLSSGASLFEGSRPVRMLLRSLKLTFEGQSELITRQLGYSAVRLIRTKHELAPPRSMMLSNDSGKGACKESTWNFTFSIPVPGWLPPTSTFGNDQYGAAGTRYALFAEAQYIFLGQGPAAGFSLSSLQSLLTSKVRVVRAAHAEINVQRFVLPPISKENPAEPMEVFPEQRHAIKPNVKETGFKFSGNIDPKIMQGIEVMAYVPEHINIHDSYFKLSVLLRASKLSLEERESLRVEEFIIDDLFQNEFYTNTPFPSYQKSFPLPAEQPNTKPLLNPHPLKTMYDVGLVSIDTDVADDACLTTSFSFSHHEGKYHQRESQLVGFSYPNSAPDEWAKVDLDVAFVAFGGTKKLTAFERSSGLVMGVRPTQLSPLFCVQHQVAVRLRCAYGRDGARVTSDLKFRVPLFFVHVPPLRLAKNLLFCGAPAKAPSSRPPTPSLPVDEEVAESFRLPPYSQLFLPNGERRPDHPIPLPPYQLRDPSHPTVEIKDGQIPFGASYSI